MKQAKKLTRKRAQELGIVKAKQKFAARRLPDGSETAEVDPHAWRALAMARTPLQPVEQEA